MARHKAVSKARWLASQRLLADTWQQDDLPKQEFKRIKRCYLPLIERHNPDINAQTRILELCCGPVCAARAIEQGKKTYLDPLLDEYRRLHPGKLPRGTHLCAPSEKVPEDDHSFDIILCFNGLDQVLNPELTLNEMARLLHPSGTVLISLTVLPSGIARLRYFFECFISALSDGLHPYSYSLQAIVHAIGRHFDIVEQQCIEEICLTESRWCGTEYAFICHSKDREQSAKRT